MASSDERVIALESPVNEKQPLLRGEGVDEDFKTLFGLCPLPVPIPRTMFNVVALGAIFMLLFTAFAPSQNLQSTINKGSNAGVYGLGALYFTFAASNFISPSIAFLLGERFAMLAGGIGYALFVASNILDHNAKYFVPLFVMASMANGLGAAVLWTAQGSYLTKNSTQVTMGRNNGIFFGLFQISQVAGNLIAAFLLPSTKNPKELEGPARKLFIIFGSIAGLAVVSFLILRKTPYRPDIDDRPAPSAGQRFIGIFKMFLKKPFLLMVLIIVYSGLSQAYFAGTFTKLIDDSKNVGYVMACFGGTDAIMSVIVGRIMNRVGRKVILFGSALCILIATGMICLIEQTLFKERIWIGIIAAVLCGISDAGMNTLLTATTGSLFEEDPENAFGAFKLVQASTSAINYVLALDIYPATLMLDIFLIIGSASFFFLDSLFPRETPGKSINNEEGA